MKKLNIYLDTSVVNFLYVDDAPDFRKATEEFFEIYSFRYELFICAPVLLEIANDPDVDHRSLLTGTLSSYNVRLLPDTRAEEIELLARIYIENAIVPPQKMDDVLHVAYATVFEMDILLSWNFKHLANIRREARFLVVNQQMGYRYPLRIVSPIEVEDEE